jgi:prephenate dehydrogenase
MLAFENSVKSVAVIGVGLIGGSFALALRAAQPSLRILGVDPDETNLDLALRRGVIDEAVSLPIAAACDVVLLAVPVRQTANVMTALSSHLPAHAVLTDTGSTKQDVIAAARTALGARVAQFVPGHPIAGREHSGVGAAVSELFDGKHVVLTPLQENSPAAVSRIRALWQACGAQVVTLPAATHDAVFAAVSHLPHLLAFALVDELAARPNAKTLFSFAASGFRDFTRIAGSSPEMWRDIALNNREALVAEMDRYLAHAARLRDAVASGDASGIESLMAGARRAREQWMAGQLDQFRDDSV